MNLGPKSVSGALRVISSSGIITLLFSKSYSIWFGFTSSFSQYKLSESRDSNVRGFSSVVGV
jgi:hypothetical protein